MPGSLSADFHSPEVSHSAETYRVSQEKGQATENRGIHLLAHPSSLSDQKGSYYAEGCHHSSSLITNSSLDGHWIHTRLPSYLHEARPGYPGIVSGGLIFVRPPRPPA